MKHYIIYDTVYTSAKLWCPFQKAGFQNSEFEPVEPVAKLPETTPDAFVLQLWFSLCLCGPSKYSRLVCRSDRMWHLINIWLCTSMTSRSSPLSKMIARWPRQDPGSVNFRGTLWHSWKWSLEILDFYFDNFPGVFFSLVPDFLSRTRCILLLCRDVLVTTKLRTLSKMLQMIEKVRSICFCGCPGTYQLGGLELVFCGLDFFFFLSTCHC